MATAQDIISVAASQLGTKEQPANSNRVKYGAWYGMNGQPWCDMFVSWCANEVGALDICGKFAYTPSHANFFKQRGGWIDRNGTAHAGDFVFFANKGTICHIGIVERVLGGGKFQTIEGNTSAGNNANGGEVQRRTRTLGTVGSSWYIAGFGRPAWNGISQKQPNLQNTQINTTVQLSKGVKVRNYGTIRKGSTGRKVKILQCVLNESAGAGLVEDGDFGGKTDAAVRNWQRANALEVDGIVGANTWGSL